MRTQIHVWSDYVCPFCLIADELIERAIVGRDDVDIVHRRMMTAFFRDDLDLGDHEVLVALASEVGLDTAGYRAALEDEHYAARHRRALADAARMDIRVVPTIVIGERRIDGVATEGVLRRALDDARLASA